MASVLASPTIRQVIFDEAGKIAAVAWSCGCSWSRLVKVECKEHAGPVPRDGGGVA